MIGTVFPSSSSITYGMLMIFGAFVFAIRGVLLLDKGFLILFGAIAKMVHLLVVLLNLSRFLLAGCAFGLFGWRLISGGSTFSKVSVQID
jgi:hypothetical protein